MIEVKSLSTYKRLLCLWAIFCKLHDNHKAITYSKFAKK